MGETPVVSPGPGASWPPNPDDRLHPVFAKIWTALIAAGVGTEIVALWIEYRRQVTGRPDRLKRTFSAFWRYVFATDSVTGVPLNVRHGRLRRFLGAMFLWWFDRHTTREGDV